MSNYKIFISYSRRDRWIAEQMVRNIEQRCGDRADVFRDERGIRGGESIPEAIRQHIIECDEFMILLTQHSVEREWVKIELGAAWGQSKLIVAVTHYVSPEEMPTIIAQNKAFDLDEFDEYLEELAGRVEEGTQGRT